MGWWESEDGTGVVGDRPADLVGAVLEESLGDRFDAELLGGFVAAVGGALLRNPSELVSDPPPPGTPLLVELEERGPVAVRVAEPVVSTGLGDAVFDALEAVAFQYREGGPERLPRLAELLETVAFAAGGKVVDPDTGEPLRLLGIRAVTPESAAHELADPDWRARMAAVLGIGHFRARQLAWHVRQVEIPPLSAGLRDEDRRALLALRDVTAARAEGVPLDRPTHPDPEIAARRRRLLDDVEAAIEGTAVPGPDSPAYILLAVLDPAAVRRSGHAPPEWRGWLADAY